MGNWMCGPCAWRTGAAAAALDAEVHQLLLRRGNRPVKASVGRRLPRHHQPPERHLPPRLLLAPRQAGGLKFRSGSTIVADTPGLLAVSAAQECCSNFSAAQGCCSSFLLLIRMLPLIR